MGFRSSGLGFRVQRDVGACEIYRNYWRRQWKRIWNIKEAFYAGVAIGTYWLRLLQ